MTAETGHKHMFPFKKPGVFGETGSCECGLTYEQAIAADRGQRDLRAEETRAEFTGWMEAQGYVDVPEIHADYMAEAFEAGMRATSPGTPVYLATIAHLAGALRDIRDANPAAPAGAYVHDRAVLALSTLPPGFARADRIRDMPAAVSPAAARLERERNLLRGQLEHAELTITDYLNTLTALRAAFDRDRVLLREADEFKVRLSALVVSLEETVKHGGCPAEEFDQGAAHASAVTARQLRAILDETALGAAPLPIAPDSVACATVTAKAAIEEAARVLGFRPGRAAAITAAFPPPVQGEEIPLAAIFDTAHPRYLEADELRAMYAGHPAVRKVIDTARGIEGRRAVTETAATEGNDRA